VSGNSLLASAVELCRVRGGLTWTQMGTQCLYTCGRSRSWLSGC